MKCEIKFRGKNLYNNEWVSGDLILIHGSSCQLTVEVIFHKGMFCYKNKACGFTPLWYVSSICEVIGNIYDNSN